MKKLFLLSFLLSCSSYAQTDNEELIRVPANYCTSGQIYLSGNSIFLNLVQSTLKPDGKISAYYSNVIELDHKGKILGTNQFGEVTSDQPQSMLTDHPLGIFVLAANKNVRLHIYQRNGKPRIHHEFEKCVSGKFLGRYGEEEIIALIKKSEVESLPGGRKQGGLEDRGQIIIYGMDDKGNISEKFLLQNLFFKADEFSLPEMMGSQLYFMNPRTGTLSIHGLANGRKVLDINMQLNKEAGEEVWWDRPLIHPEGRIYCRATRTRIKPAFRFIESWIFETDSMGNKTHETELTEFIEPETHNSSIVTRDNGILLLITAHRPELFRYDENLNYQWMKTLKLKKTFAPCAIKELPDESVLMLAFTDHLGNTRPFLIQLHKNGQPKTLFY